MNCVSTDMIKSIGGLKVYYEVAGSGEPVLLLHGWANDVETLRPLMRMVKDLGFRVFAVDLPGFGLSDTPQVSWGVDEYVDLVSKLLDELALERVSIIGHSFGGGSRLNWQPGTPGESIKWSWWTAQGLSLTGRSAAPFRPPLQSCSEKSSRGCRILSVNF